jgi:hypothetical protein
MKWRPGISRDDDGFHRLAPVGRQGEADYEDLSVVSVEDAALAI